MTKQTPKAPKWADGPAKDEMQSKAVTLMAEVKDATGPALYRVIDKLGADSQKKLVAANDTMRGTVDGLLKGMDGSSPAADQLLALRGTFDELNPNSLANSWWFSWMPKGIKRSAIRRFTGKYASMQSHVDSIMNGLLAGKDSILESNIELEAQYREIEAAHQQVQADIFVGEKLFAMIEAKEAETDSDDKLEIQKLANAKNTVARRIRDLRTKESAAVQFFVSIDQTMHSNVLLGEQIDSALSVGPMVMTNALRIQAALAKQNEVKNAVAEFQEGLGQMMVENAANVEQAAQQIGDLYNNPVIAMQHMQEGHDKLMNAVSIASQTMAEGTLKAREISAQMAAMSEDLLPVAQAMKASRPAGEAPAPEALVDGSEIEEAQ